MFKTMVRILNVIAVEIILFLVVRMSFNRKVANLRYFPEFVCFSSMFAFMGVLLIEPTWWSMILGQIYAVIAILSSFVIVKEENARQEKKSDNTSHKEF